MKVLRLLGVLALAGCGATMPTSHTACTPLNSRYADTLYVPNVLPPRIEAILYSDCQ